MPNFAYVFVAAIWSKTDTARNRRLYPTGGFSRERPRPTLDARYRNYIYIFIHNRPSSSWHTVFVRRRVAVGIGTATQQQLRSNVVRGNVLETTLGDWKEKKRKKTNNTSRVFMNNRDAKQCQGRFFPLRPPEVSNVHTYIINNKPSCVRERILRAHIVFCSSVPIRFYIHLLWFSSRGWNRF